jgi:Gpi18-like mannosyltransferase
VDGLVRWDGFHYANIALHGYDRMKTVFFPLYPLLVASVRMIVGNVYVAGLLVSNAALLVALCYLYALARREYDQAGATRTVFYLATAPGSVFFWAMYTESLFVALVNERGSLLRLMPRRHPGHLGSGRTAPRHA